jgi:hypothetical protein
MRIKKCAICKKDITSYTGIRKYCSYKCAQQAAKLRSKSKSRKETAKRRKNLKSKDIAWSLEVKELAGNRCEYCGKTEYLNSHHIFSRSNRKLRWDTENGVCLCSGHHLFSLFSAHKSPLEFAEWLKQKRGVRWYEKLRRKAKGVIE